LTATFLYARKVVSEADDYQPHSIAPEQGYRGLIDGALGYFKGPAKASVDAVHFILKELVRKSLDETQKLKRRISPQKHMFTTLSEDGYLTVQLQLHFQIVPSPRSLAATTGGGSPQLFNDKSLNKQRGNFYKSKETIDHQYNFFQKMWELSNVYSFPRVLY